MEFKIKPIKGCEEITFYGSTKKRFKKFGELAEHIKAILKETGFKEIEVEHQILHSYPDYSFKLDGYDFMEFTNKYVGYGYGWDVKEVKFLFNFFYDFKLIVAYKEDENEFKYYRYYKGDVNMKLIKEKVFFLMLIPDIKTHLHRLFEYLESVYNRGIIDLEEFIKNVVPIYYEIRKSYRKISDVFENTKKALGIEELGEWEWKRGNLSIYGLPKGHFIFVDNRLKLVSEKELPDYKDKLIENASIPWFSFEKGKIVYIPVYIYDFSSYREIKEYTDELISKEMLPQEFLFQIKKLKKFGIYYSDDVLNRFYAAINSGNKFVILAGATGTGKTLLSLLYPACIYKKEGKTILEKLIEECEKEEELKEKIQKELKDYICFLRVRPNWTSPKEVIGFVNPLKNEFIKAPLYDFLIKANNNNNSPFFLILDEMNLSHPEHYLSDILSAMETKGEIYIHNDKELENRGIKKRISYPSNLHIIGTINIDETTKELSPRLKSRAFLVELRADFDKFKEECEDEKEKQIAEILGIIDRHLSKINLGLGYRDIKHIKDYVEKGGTIGDALIQKIIPRIRTDDEKFKYEVVPNIIKELKELENFRNHTKNFCDKLEELKEKFETQGFV